MKLIFLLICFCLFINSKGQNPALQFDGVDDHVDIGTNVGNGVRTIEMWFKLDAAITPQLNGFKPLVAREISLSNNTNEFVICFQPSNVMNPGTLRFDIDGTSPWKSVFSDNDTWNANQWYHVAAVIDPLDGMKLFIDGVNKSVRILTI